MNRRIETAIKCFDENIKLYGNPITDPEKYNLYNGLASLSEAISELQNQIGILQNMINVMRFELSQKK